MKFAVTPLVPTPFVPFRALHGFHLPQENRVVDGAVVVALVVLGLLVEEQPSEGGLIIFVNNLRFRCSLETKVIITSFK